MTRTLLLEYVCGQTRLAVIEDGKLCEIDIHRPGSDDASGSIYLGRVDNFVPGMDAAFVDIGLEKKGFLYAGDVPRGKPLRPGMALPVQVSKAQSGQKGHRLTGRVTFPGRTMALLPGQAQVGVSKKITDPAERERLRAIGETLIGKTDLGLILRTASEGVSEEALRREFDALALQWRGIEKRVAHAMPPTQLFDNESLPLRCARELLDDGVDAIWVDGAPLFEEVGRYIDVYASEKRVFLKLHEGMTPLFDLYRVDVQLDKALRKYVWLKSGGSLVIEETEAMTVIDVNTGKFTGSGKLEDTIFRINREAAMEIARQLRLRNIGGIVIVDFIDMAEPAHNEELLELLRELAKRDRSRLSVVGMTGLGLVEMTRKKTRRPLSRQLLHTCSACGGDGMTPDHETTARRIAREIWKRRRQGEANPMLVSANGKVLGWMKTIGAPGEGAVYGISRETVKPGEYDISPADEAHLPEGAKRIK